MRLRDIMTKDVASIQPQMSVSDAAKIMQAHNVGAIPITTPDNTVVGIVTDRDIVVRNIANDGDAKSAKVEDMMTEQLVFGTPDMYVSEAAQLMAQNQIRRLPVVENGKLVGIVALGDLATTELSDERAGETLSDISTPSKPFNI